MSSPLCKSLAIQHRRPQASPERLSFHFAQIDPRRVRRLAASSERGCPHPAHRGSCPTDSCPLDERASAARPRALQRGRARSPSGPRRHRCLDRQRGRAQEPVRHRPLDRRCALSDGHPPTDACRRSPPQGPRRERRRLQQDRRPHVQRHSPPRQGSATEPCAFPRRRTPGCLQSPHGAVNLNQRASHTPTALSQRNPQPSLQWPEVTPGSA